jgi:hypothetical protein
VRFRHFSGKPEDSMATFRAKAAFWAKAWRGGLAAAGGLLALASPGPAQAQFFFGLPFYRQHYYQPPVVMDELTPREVIATVREYGFRDATRPVFRDDVAQLLATDREGRRLRLTVDLYSGRIVNAVPARQQLAQRAPDQGAAVRRAVPDVKRDARAVPDRPPTTVRREPMLPPQPDTIRPRQAKPPKAQPAPQPPTARAPAPVSPVVPGTPARPRRIDIVPPATLDDVKPQAVPAPSGPPINSVPVAPLE